MENFQKFDFGNDIFDENFVYGNNVNRNLLDSSLLEIHKKKDFDETNFLLKEYESQVNQQEQEKPDEKSSDEVINTFAIQILEREVISYPLTVLRKTCQINQLSGNYLDPFTSLKLLCKVSRKYGIVGMCKGLPSVLMIKGLFFSVENYLGRKWLGILSPWVTHVLFTSFYSANAMEIVQSLYASEQQGLISFVRLSFSRMFHWKSSASNRMLSIFILTGPTLAYEICFFAGSEILKYLYYQTTDKTKKESKWEIIYKKISLSIGIKFLTTIALYPLETICNRLYLQGTRTLIDNFDNDFKVIPVISNYEGTSDCYDSIILTEGYSGLYKGFGLLCLQCGLEFSAIWLFKTAVKQFSST